jgi:putative acetyltransferase
VTGWGLRKERPGDEPAIRRVTATAFAGHPYSDGSEPAIVDALRGSGDLALSLVAEADGAIVGHVAFSPASLSGGEPGWLTLGPISVLPEWQGRGIGRALIEAGIRHCRESGAKGLVVLGDPALYARFGFVRRARLRIDGPLSEYFQVLPLGDDAPAGTVEFAPAFGPNA